MGLKSDGSNKVKSNKYDMNGKTVTGKIWFASFTFTNLPRSAIFFTFTLH